LRKRDLARGEGWVGLPDALDRKYPEAPWALGWQFVFASRQLSDDPRSGNRGRHHVHEGAVQRADRTWPGGTVGDIRDTPAMPSR
jgi:hypothetical protein